MIDRTSVTGEKRQHPWSPEKAAIAGQYQEYAETNQRADAAEWAVYFADDVMEFDALLSRVGKKQTDFNQIYYTSYQQIINNLKAGQPREEAIEDAKNVLLNIKPVEPWTSSKRRR